MRWLLGIIVVLVLAFVGYRFLQTEQGQQAVNQAVEQAQTAAQQAQKAAGQAVEAASEAAQDATRAAQQAADAAGQAASAAGEAAQQAAAAAGQAAQDTAALAVGGVDVGAEIKGLVEQASTALGGITDAASAEAALPTLQDLQGKIDGLTAQVDQLPAEGRKLLAALVSTALPTLKQLAGTVTSVEGAAAIKPAVDGMIRKLEAWAQAPA